MLSARQSAIRLLQLMMIASVVLPTVLFAWASWLAYRYEYAIADERIERSLDILHEHTLKVFQTVERSIAEVDEIMRGLSDEAIRDDQPRLHDRLQRIVAGLPQLRAIFLVDRNGEPLVSSQLAQVPTGFNVRDRSFFQVHIASHAGIFVSEVISPRLTAFNTPFFVLSRRRPTVDGSFDGIVAVAVLPQYFEEFYALIDHSPGSAYALLRADGSFLARYPEMQDRERVLAPGSGLHAAISAGWERVIYTVAHSQIDSAERRIGFLKLEGFPVYVVAGIEASAIRAEWLGTMGSHLIFGLPATCLLLLIIGLALKRTRRLHAEADRREAAEAALRQAQRLEAVGKLTGGVAHDFNNLLMVVSGSVERLRRDLKEPKHVRLLDMIATATKRGESLTRQLLAFSRRQTLAPSVIDLNQHLPELKDLLNRSLRGDITTEVEVRGEACAIKVDANELELALLNLAVNARDAMPGGGALRITAEPVVLDGKPGEQGLQGDFVAIRVSDSGRGIPPEVLPHVFEPFFTTKDVGKGTGLGLSQVFSFAKQAGGAVAITSAIGRGTVVTLYLPRTQELAAPSIAPADHRGAAQQAGTVLLVEDNVAVAEVASTYLQQLGYQVKHFARAQDAMAWLAQNPEIDLVFSDVLMPGGMNGLELGRAIRKLYPRIPVLLTTGFASSARDAVEEGFVLLQKPFDLAALEQAVAELQPQQSAQQVDPDYSGCGRPRLTR
ncbi:MAG TPA: ATP-binding protein [Xanthobacteraceae bacterium]